ncbi:MAG: glutamate--tRNA ligase [Alphaproteobacteria bacterium]|nr:MAG: glutamate--tRNA ligase [Alphaproteobacteria bacterium]
MASGSSPVTRFAPSPTGMLHIGGARTALFNWLFARHEGGKFLLRIEDTDRERSTAQASTAILDGLRWLELEWDGEVTCQSKHIERHGQVAQTLLDQGKAYHCYCSPEELTEMRQRAKAQGRPALYDGRWRDRDPSDAPQGVNPVLRIKAPRQGETVIHDRVQGEVRVSNRQLDDFILLRSDQTPTYMLSVVVDDHDMSITHIIRGDDHLTNAFRQQVIYDALGWGVPEFAHIPLLHGTDGAKLSKRHGALSVSAYKDMGYLPAAMRNYLLRLGWSHGDDEIISNEQAIEWFNLDSLGKSAARFDIDKLNYLNGHYIRQLDDQELSQDVLNILKSTNSITVDQTAQQRLLAAMPEFKQRAKTLIELADNCVFLVSSRPLPLTEKAQSQLSEQAPALLAELRGKLETTEHWTAEALDKAIRTFADKKGLKFGKVAQPLRAALTGGASSPGIFDVLAILGREESLGRIQDQAAAD